MNAQTPRRLGTGTLVIASHNAGKVAEIGDLLRPFGTKVVSVGALQLPVPDETETTFIGNAMIKARAAAAATGLPALADDSGLCVHALGGEPGVYSADWGGPERDFALAMRRVEERLQGVANRRAHFVCALVVCWPDGQCASFEGVVHGELIWPPRGCSGFGYDPLFVPDGYAQSFGEMTPEEKHRISHRADAFAKLVSACF
ncbi:RdgB/HAM1 family non-canonical purine NTP pyrophosphatase [Defluviicoccus vanus]|uniref:dITP/XTP pyrophosphatase n=1 Tax=Defluviicoccus vanus TaxID=111831 RepID=A0A7H1N0U8_9PROT|nr:RdgB/HAM1 family non-canonical purine NTP pyrophosphatase [Defluviicoccus vanus]QNT69334.1 RdgB/HAM1 family non-canonical purine NTP pyrophosphatase [Defluviicoccus vanus]